jgi:hypothetical protein
MIGLGALMEVGGKLIDKLIPDPEAKAKAQLELAQMQQNGELQRMADETKRMEIEQTNVSQRWQADMGSDSWLSKNVRPMTLVYILTAYLVLAIMDGFGFKVAESYVQLLGQWGIVVFGAYFGSRAIEKVTSIRSRK